MRAARRTILTLTALCVLSPLASAYYYWIFFTGAAGGPALPGRFDLSALKDNSVQYFISSQGPAALVGGDTLNALYSQIQRAAQVWNRVPTSALRLSFGGIAPIGTPQSAPGIDVVFDDDMPPGILAQTIPTFPADLSFLTGSAPPGFVPMLRAKLQLHSDLAGQAQASFSDEFFLTLVHEFGHTMGLQHTLTSAVMSTAVTRGVQRGTPLAADDIAGISLLYPTPGYARTTGSVSGQVTLNKAGVNLASVVALSTNGTVISTLSNPDGSYEIDGIPAGSYYVYAHPLPPTLSNQGEHAPANITTPVDPQGDSFAANLGFSAQFYPGTRDWTQAKQVGVGAGAITANVNFAVTARPGPALSSMEVFGYQNQAPVSAPPLAAQTAGITLVFDATGATVASSANDGQQMAAGLTVSAIGGAASIEPGSLKYYQQGFLEIAVDTGALNGGVPTPVALALTLNNDLYVLPAAFTVVAGSAPAISGLTEGVDAQGALTATITGQNLSAQTQFFIDGAAAPVTAVTSADPNNGVLTIAPGPGIGGLTSTLEAVNPDGQTSLQALPISASGGDPRALFNYPFTNPLEVSATPGILRSGHDTWIALVGNNTHFSSASVVGLGTSDIAVRRVWAASPTLLLADISVSAAAQAGATTNLTVATGLELVTLPDAITISAPDDAATLQLPVVSANTGLAGVVPGGTALIATAGIDMQSAPLNAFQLYIAGEPAGFSADANGVLTAQIPADLATGPQIVQLVSPGGIPLPTVLMQLDVAPPVITGAFLVQSDGTLAPVTAAAPALPGSTIQLAVIGLDNTPASAIWMNAGPLTAGDISNAGINYPAQAVVPNQGGGVLVQFQLPQDLSSLLAAGSVAQLPVMVGTGTRLSAAFGVALGTN